jgi:hypothetical protein
VAKDQLGADPKGRPILARGAPSAAWTRLLEYLDRDHRDALAGLLTRAAKERVRCLDKVMEAAEQKARRMGKSLSDRDFEPTNLFSDDDLAQLIA